MYVVREILNCKPGRVRALAEKFRVMSTALEELGERPLRILTDVASEPFWTLVAEASVEGIDDFFGLERRLMDDARVRGAMADYHDLVVSGRREIFRIES